MAKNSSLRPYRLCALLACFLFIGTAFAQEGSERAYARWTWHNADVRSVFMELAKVSGVDIVLSDNVQGTLSITVTNKSWKDVVNIICKLKKYSLVKENDYLLVLTKDEFQRDQLTTAVNQQATEDLSPLRRDIVRLSNMTADEMEKSVTNLLSQRGKITVAQHSNALIIYDTDNNINQIKSMIKRLDIETEQICISAKIIEVSSTNLQQAGISWGLFNTVNGADVTAMHIPNQNPVPNALEQLTWGILTGQKFQAVLQFLFTEGKGEVVAQPSITTIDNKVARVFMGGQIRVTRKDVAQNTIVDYKEAGTELVVTPHVTNGNRILLDINAKKESADPDGNIQSKVATTNVVLSNGETVVIAGLTSTEKTQSEEGIPILKDIPLLGHLFKKSSKNIDKRDLLIFVTPTVIQKQIDAVQTQDSSTAGN
jgi:type II secretory pathway component GspD/PulD (secretin)